MSLTKLGGMASNSLGPSMSGALQALGVTDMLADLGLNGLLRSDPDIGYRYFIEIDGIGTVRFKEASGLKCTTKVTKIREGGNNVFEHAMIDSQTYEPLTIKKGFYARTDEFFLWMKDIHDPGTEIERKTIAIVVLNDRGVEVCRFNIFGAFITEYDGPAFDSQGKDIIFESVKINYDYFVLEVPSLLDLIAEEMAAAAINAV